MASFLTSILSGIQGASAAKNATKDQVEAGIGAAASVNNATNDVNPKIASASQLAGERVTNATGDAQGNITNAANDAARDVTNAGTTAAGNVRTSAGAAATGVTGAAVDANKLLSPYSDAGANATTKLNDLINNPAEFKFSQDDPSYQWRLQQGQQALERSAAAHGSAQGGGVMKALLNYGQGAASQEYAAAFDRFNKTQNNRQNLLTGLADRGLTASQSEGLNLTGAAKYAGDITTGAEKTAGDYEVGAARYAGDTHTTAAQVNGGLGVSAARYVGDTGMHSTEVQANNTLNAARYEGDMKVGIGNAKAAGHIGSANAWNGMLNGIGAAGDMALAGGFGGGGGFPIFGKRPPSPTGTDLGW